MPLVNLNDVNQDNNSLLESNTPISRCNECKQFIYDYQNYLECKKCSKKFHTKCCKVFGIHIQRAADKEWFCKDCKPKDVTAINNSPKRKASDDIENSNQLKRPNVSSHNIDERFDQVIKYLTDMQNFNQQLKSSVDDVASNQNLIHSQISELHNKFESISVKYEQLKNSTDTNSTLIEEHSKLITEMDAQLDCLKQKELENNIVITNLPNNIDPNDTLSKILKALDSNIKMCDIRDIKMLSKNNFTNNSQTTRIINRNAVMLVTFKNISDKVEFMERKKNKKTIFTHEIGLNTPSDQQIFFRDHLTRNKMKLFDDARKIKEKFKLKYLWIKDTSILIRKNDNSKVYNIKSSLDIKIIEQIFLNEQLSE